MSEPTLENFRDSWACEHVRPELTVEERRAEFDRMVEAVRAEEREKAAQIAETSYEDQPTWLRSGIARLIREQGKEQGS